MGYHVRDIPKGEFGELSKIQEEFAEAMDAEEQKNPIMLLVELAEIVGAIEGYLEQHFANAITIKDVIVMAKATKRAFQSGDRQCAPAKSTTDSSPTQ